MSKTEDKKPKPNTWKESVDIALEKERKDKEEKRKKELDEVPFRMAAALERIAAALEDLSTEGLATFPQK